MTRDEGRNESVDSRTTDSSGGETGLNTEKQTPDLDERGYGEQGIRGAVETMEGLAGH